MSKRTGVNGGGACNGFRTEAKRDLWSTFERVSSLASLDGPVKENTFLPWLVLVGLVDESNFPTGKNYPPPC
jgi:hypothetical protein